MGRLAPQPPRHDTGQPPRELLLCPHRTQTRWATRRSQPCAGGPTESIIGGASTSAGSQPGLLLVSPALVGEGQWQAAGPLTWRRRRDVCRPVPSRHHLYQPDHQRRVGRSHPAAGHAGSRCHRTGRDMAAAPDITGPAMPAPWPRSTAGSASRTPTGASTSMAAGRSRSAPGPRRSSSTPTASSTSAPGAAR